MAKDKEAQAPQTGAVQEEVKTVDETQTEEILPVEEAQAPQTGAASLGGQYIKTIPNKFDVAGCDIPDEEFDPSDLDMDEMQEKAFSHAVKCGIIKEVE